MIKNSFILLVLVIAFGSCSGKYSDYPLEKRYWTPADYKTVIFKLKYPKDREERLPTFDNPETRLILEKLTDEENFLVVLDDETLGLKYRNEVSDSFFDHWKEMNKIYWDMDRQDKYIYPMELVKCFQFGLALQLKYFKLGNDALIENSSNPNENETQKTVSRNIAYLVGNFNNYLDVVKNEDALSNDALVTYAEGLKKYFSQLINLYPKANYQSTKVKMEYLKSKIKNQKIIESIEIVIGLIDEVNPLPTSAELSSVTYDLNERG